MSYAYGASPSANLFAYDLDLASSRTYLSSEEKSPDNLLNSELIEIRMKKRLIYKSRTVKHGKVKTLSNSMKELRYDGDAYIQRLAAHINGRFNCVTTPIKITATQQSDSAIRARLIMRNDCDITNLSCLILFCGRSFDSLQVLAWHMSYAHQDISINSKANATCFLCGFKMSTAKGKNAHLLAKHRSIAYRHNIQCLYQRDAVIAPGAPAAERLRLQSD